MHVGVTLEPAVVFRLMGVEIVENGMDGCIRISGGDLIHEVEELDASTAAFVGSYENRGPSKQVGIGSHDRTTKLEHQAAVEIEPENLVFDSPAGSIDQAQRAECYA